MPTDPLTGARVPDGSYAPDITQVATAIFDISDNTIPFFASTTARDSAYSSWVANGGAMRNSLICAVGTTLYKYASGAWVVMSTDTENRMMRAQRNANVTGFPTGSAWTSFSDNTSWTEVDPWNMRGNGAQLTAPWTGWYDMTGTIWWNNNNTGYRSLGFLPSAGLDIGEGAGSVIALDQRDAVAGGVDTIQTGTHKFLMTAGQSVTMQGRQNSGGQLQVNAVRISATFLGPNT